MTEDFVKSPPLNSRIVLCIFEDTSRAPGLLLLIITFSSENKKVMLNTSKNIFFKLFSINVYSVIRQFTWGKHSLKGDYEMVGLSEKPFIN